MNYSPYLSIGTATLEIAAAIWALRGPGRKSIIRITSMILLFLAGYQVIEALFCTGLLEISTSLLPRLAFIVVAWLPPTGLLLVAHLFPTHTRTIYRYAYAMYMLCAGLVVGIMFQKNFVIESVCMVVFARYTNPTTLFKWYGIFYQSGLFSMLLLSAWGVILCDDHRQRLLLGQVLLGCIAFIFPAMVTVSVIPIAEDALPSILCHFALLLAMFLVRLLVIERRSSLQPEMFHNLPTEILHNGSV